MPNENTLPTDIRKFLVFHAKPDSEIHTARIFSRPPFLSSKVLETDSPSFSNSFYEVKGKATRRVLGVGLSQFEEMMKLVSIPRGIGADLWLPMGPRARIYSSHPAAVESYPESHIK